MTAETLQADVREHLGISLPQSFAVIFDKFAWKLRISVPVDTIVQDLETLFFLECETEKHSAKLEAERSTPTRFTKRTTRRVFERIVKRIKRDEEKQHQFLPLDLEPSILPPENVFWELVESLNPEEMEVVEGYFLQGLTLDEISKKIDCPRATVHRRLQAALSRLQERL